MARYRCFAALLCFVSAPTCADNIRVAVASNFAETAKVLVREFKVRSTHDVSLLIGSTGKHYAQIRNGLPVDVLLAADRDRPELIEQSGLGVVGSRFTYAIGRLVLWSALDQELDESSLLGFTGGRVAIANPKLAPYGMAAQQVMESLGVYQALKSMLVRGENVAQAYQFVATGNTQMGFIARSQIQPGQRGYWLVPARLHQPIEQQAVLIRKGDAAEAFMTFLRSEKALELIRVGGYDTP